MVCAFPIIQQLNNETQIPDQKYGEVSSEKNLKCFKTSIWVRKAEGSMLAAYCRELGLARVTMINLYGFKRATHRCAHISL